MNLKPKKQQLLGLLPESLVMVRGSRYGGSRYLTFDDGPEPEHTPRLLDLLAEHGVHATFFLIGEKVERYPELVERMVREGHRLGNHSYSHYSFRPMSLEKKLYEVNHTDELLYPFDGLRHHPMRPPRGDMAPSLLWYFAKHRRLLVHWSYDSLDYQDSVSEAALLARLREQPPQPGDIVLMHDDSSKAADALRVVLPEWLAAGYRFRVLPETLA